MSGIWTPDTFRALGLALFGLDWQRRMAAALDVAEDDIRAWDRGDIPMPDDTSMKRGRCFGLGDDVDARWRRDTWVIGEGERRNGRRGEYVLRTRQPRFIARAVEVDDEGRPVPAEGEVDMVTGVRFQAGPDTVLTEIQWIDRAPGIQDLVRLCEEAAEALADIDNGAALR